MMFLSHLSESSIRVTYPCFRVMYPSQVSVNPSHESPRANHPARARMLCGRVHRDCPDSESPGDGGAGNDSSWRTAHPSQWGGGLTYWRLVI